MSMMIVVLLDFRNLRAAWLASTFGCSRSDSAKSSSSAPSIASADRSPVDPGRPGPATTDEPAAPPSPDAGAAEKVLSNDEFEQWKEYAIMKAGETQLKKIG